MPHYYFHLRTIDGTERDEEGITFKSLDDAKADALSSLFEMVSEDAKGERKSKLLGIDITDGQQNMLASVRLGDGNTGQSVEDAKHSNEGHAFIHGRGGKDQP